MASRQRDLTTSQWLQHTIEELLDAANYMRVLLSRQMQDFGVIAIDPDPARSGPVVVCKHIGWRWRHKTQLDGWVTVYPRALYDGDAMADAKTRVPSADKDLIIEELYA